MLKRVSGDGGYYEEYPPVILVAACRLLLLHLGSEGLALLPNQAYDALHQLRRAGVLRIVDMLGRDICTLPRLKGYWRLPQEREQPELEWVFRP